jgi:hypothetical protein
MIRKILVSVLMLSLIGCEDQSKSVKTPVKSRPSNLSPAQSSAGSVFARISDFQGDWILFNAESTPTMVRFDPTKIPACSNDRKLSISRARRNGRAFHIDAQGSMGLPTSIYITDDLDLDLADLDRNIDCRISEKHPAFNYDMKLGKMKSEDPNTLKAWGFSNIQIRKGILVLAGLWCYDLMKNAELFFCQNDIVFKDVEKDVFFLTNLRPKQY